MPVGIHPGSPQNHEVLLGGYRQDNQPGPQYYQEPHQPTSKPEETYDRRTKSGTLDQRNR